MELNDVVSLINNILSGGPHAIIIILIMAIMYLWYQNNRLNKEITKKDDRINDIVDDYVRGNTTIATTLESLKSVLYEIKGSLK